MVTGQSLDLCDQGPQSLRPAASHVQNGEQVNITWLGHESKSLAVQSEYATIHVLWLKVLLTIRDTQSVNLTY